MPDFPPGCPANTSNTCPKWNGQPLFPHPLSLPQSSPAQGMTTAAHRCQSLLSLSASLSHGGQGIPLARPSKHDRKWPCPAPSPAPRICTPLASHRVTVLAPTSTPACPLHCLLPIPPAPTPCPCPLSPILNKEPELPFHNTRQVITLLCLRPCHNPPVSQSSNKQPSVAHRTAPPSPHHLSDSLPFHPSFIPSPPSIQLLLNLSDLTNTSEKSPGVLLCL